jgi:hypothetical protein
MIYLLTTVNAQNLEVTPIQAKNGYLIFQTGSIDLPINYEYHYLSVNLTKTEIIYEELIKQAHFFENLQQIKYLIEKLNREMNGIRIAKRSKRGLANFMGTIYKYLFGTLDQEDKEELQQQIGEISKNNIQISELNHVIDAINKGIEVTNHLNHLREQEQMLALVIFNLQQFTEYIEDIELGLQLTRLGIFNPKLLRHDSLTHVNSEKLLSIKTSAWLKSDTNEILIISQIPREIIKTPIFEIVPYPDKENNILTETIHDKYFSHNNQTYTADSQSLVINKCITGILNQIATQCRYSKTHSDFEIKYVEPNIITTWNLPKTILNQNCINREITIEGNNMIKASNCSVQLEEILITNTMLDYTQTIYVNNNVTKLEPLEYIQAKEIIEQHAQTNNIFQIIIITALAIIIVLALMYFIYKYKTIPQRLIVKFRNSNPENETIVKPEVENVVPTVDTPVLYPRISA